MACGSCETAFRFYDSIQQTAVEWLWYPYIPLGKVTVIQGDPGDGKTMLALNIAALLSVGHAMPISDRKPLLGNSIYQSSEDNVADTIKPRLLGAGADCSKIAFIEKTDVDISSDIELLEDNIRATEAKLLVLDPLQAYIGRDFDLYRAGDMRRLMRGIATVAAKTGCAIVAIGHMNKASGAKNLYRGLGSIDITASARSVLLVGRAEENREIRMITQIKNSLALEGAPIAFEIGESSCVRFLENYASPSDCGENGELSVEDGKRELAADIIINMLSSEPKRCTDIFSACELAGIKSRTVETAKKDLGVRSVRKPDGWYWELGGVEK
jgi:hypothetical protein